MAVSKELKEFITRKFQEKIYAINTAKTKAMDELLEVKYSKGDEIYAEIKDKIQSVASRLKREGYSLDYTFRNFVDCGHRPFSISLNKSELSQFKHFDAEIEKINKQRDMLLIKLSLSKKFDEINVILADYGIAL